MATGVRRRAPSSLVNAKHARRPSTARRLRPPPRASPPPPPLSAKRSTSPSPISIHPSILSLSSSHIHSITPSLGTGTAACPQTPPTPGSPPPSRPCMTPKTRLHGVCLSPPIPRQRQRVDPEEEDSVDCHCCHCQSTGQRRPVHRLRPTRGACMPRRDLQRALVDAAVVVAVRLCSRTVPVGTLAGCRIPSP